VHVTKNSFLQLSSQFIDIISMTYLQLQAISEPWICYTENYFPYCRPQILSQSKLLKVLNIFFSVAYGRSERSIIL